MRSRLHDGVHPLAEVGVGDAEHRDVDHRRMRDQRVLGFLGIDVHPTGDDHERLAIGEEQVPVGVEVADVADGGRTGAVGRDGGRGLRRVLVVRERAAFGEVHAADLTRRQFVAVVVEDADASHERLAHRTRVRRPVRTADEGEAVELGAAVVLVDRDAERQPPLEHLLLDVDRARRCGVHARPQRREVVARARPRRRA